MFTTLRTAVIAGLVGLTALAAVPAKADGFYLQLGDGDAGVYRGESGRTYIAAIGIVTTTARSTVANIEHRCTPERALYKAERIGVRRARIADVSRRTISIVGRSRGERVYVTFARAPSCPIIG